MTARNDGEVQGLHEHRAPRWWLAAFVVVVAAVVLPGRALAVDQAMEPNSILAAESFVGAQMTTPEDGRLRGYGFAATITSTGTADGATRLLSTFRPAAGQRLAAFALRFDSLRDDTSHPVRATLVVDGRRTALVDGDFVRSGERMYAASVPNDVQQVDLEMSAAGLAQVFSLTDGRRVGDQPIVLYRDPVAPEPSSDVNTERTVAASDDRLRGAVRFRIRRVRLSWFSPGEPISTPPSPDQAFLVVEGEGDGVQPSFGTEDYGRYFSNFEALSVEAFKATLPGGDSLAAQHAGPSDGLLGGMYYFTVPADMISVKLTLSPTTVRGNRYRGFVGEPSTIQIEDAAEFDLSLPPGDSAPRTPSTAAPTTTEARPVDPTRVRSERGGGLGWLWWAALAVVAPGVAVVAAWRYRRPYPRRAILARRVTAFDKAQAEPADGRDHEDEDDDSPVMVLGLLRGPLKRIDGPGAVAAVRASVAYAITAAAHDPEPERDRALLVAAHGDTERLLPPEAPLPSWVRVVTDEETLFTEIEIAHIRFTRQREHYEQDRDAGGRQPSPPVPILTVVTPGPDDPKAWQRLRALERRAHDARYTLTLVCVGGRFGPWVRVEADGRVSASDETLAPDLQAWMLSEADASARLARHTDPVARTSRQPLPSPSEWPPGPAPTAAKDARITVRLLGPYRIAAGETEIASGLRSKARELLAYLAVNRDGSTADAAIEALFPGATADRGQGHLRTVVGNLRTVLRAAADLADDTPVVERIGPRYRLDPRLLAVDVWQFVDALAATSADGDDATASAAAGFCGGEFAAGEDYSWAEPVRERLRRKAIDHLSALAERRRETGDLEGALRVAEQAMGLDIYAEELYRAVIEIQHLLGRVDAAQRTYQLLERHLGDIGRQPSTRARTAIDGV